MATEYKKQVNASHYRFKKYYSPERWMSYYHQISELLSLNDAESILEVGPANPLVKNMIGFDSPYIKYQTVDIADDVDADYKGEITALPNQSDTFDVVCAFQVLEHIPYADAPKALAEMARVSRKYVLLSLPHHGSHIRFEFKVPMLRRKRFAYKLPSRTSHVFDGQHYWEIGKKGYEIQKIRALLTDTFEILHDFIPYENQYHHFFSLKIK